LIWQSNSEKSSSSSNATNDQTNEKEDENCDSQRDKHPRPPEQGIIITVAAIGIIH
jgi:hypothetical protein